MIQQQQTDSGVSPVIGVILMVAITVIIAAVVANFVLDLGGTLQEDADATITFDQTANYADSTYDLTVTTTSLDNADYTYVQVAGGEDSVTGVEQQVSNQNAIDNEVSESDRDRAMVTSGDRIVLEGIIEEIDVQVFGVLEGNSNQVSSQSVSDPQRFFSGSGEEEGEEEEE